MPRTAHTHGHHSHAHYHPDQRAAHASTHTAARRRSRDALTPGTVPRPVRRNDADEHADALGPGSGLGSTNGGVNGSNGAGNGHCGAIGNGAAAPNNSAAMTSGAAGALPTGKNNDPTLPTAYTSVESAEAFWCEIDALLVLPEGCGLTELDNTLRMFVGFCAAYHGE